MSRARRSGDGLDRLDRLAREDDGSALPLLLGASALALVLTLLVAAASSLYLERKRLLVLADGAALVGAEAFELDAVQRGEDGALSVRLDPARVEDAVRGYLAENPIGDFEGLLLEEVTSLDGRSATVAVSAAWSPPLLALLVPEGLRVEATATARTVFR